MPDACGNLDICRAYIDTNEDIFRFAHFNQCSNDIPLDLFNKNRPDHRISTIFPYFVTIIDGSML